MTTSNKVEQFYNSLVKDPELDIKPGQTREQAARMEANYRARQYDNNAKALAMATTPDESPINSLFNHLEQMKKAVDDVVLIKAVEEYSKKKFKDRYVFIFGGGDETAEKGWGFSSRVGKLSDKQQQNLSTNLFEYTDTTKDGMSNIDEAAATDITEHLTSLPEELREKVFQTFIKSNPVDISASSSRRDSLLKNKYLARKNAKRLTPAGFAHLLSFNKHGDFKLSNSKGLKDLSNLTNVESIVPKNYNDLKPTQEEIDNYYSDELFENRDTAKKWFDAQRPQTRRDFGNVSSTANEYHGGMGGTNSLKAADIDDHIANYNKVLDSEGELDYYDNTELTNKHDSTFFDSSESNKKTQADKKDPKDSSDESVGPSATIHGVTLDSGYLEDQGDGTYKIDPMALEADDFKRIWSGVGESEGQSTPRTLHPEHRKYLEGLSFKAGDTVGKEPSNASQGSLENEIKTDRFTTTTSPKTSSKKGSESSSKQTKTKTTKKAKTDSSTKKESKTKATSSDDNLIDKAKESGVFDYLYSKTHGTDEGENPFGSKEDFEEELRTMGADKLRKKLRDEFVKMGKDNKKQAAEKKEEKKEETQVEIEEDTAKADQLKETIKQAANSSMAVDKNLLNWAENKGDFKGNNNDTKKAATLLLKKHLADYVLLKNQGLLNEKTDLAYMKTTAALKKLGADTKEIKSDIDKLGDNWGNTDYINQAEQKFSGKEGTFFSDRGPLKNIEKLANELKQTTNNLDDMGDSTQEFPGDAIPVNNRGYITPSSPAPEGVTGLKTKGGALVYDKTQVQAKDSATLAGQKAQAIDAKITGAVGKLFGGSSDPTQRAQKIDAKITDAVGKIKPTLTSAAGTAAKVGTQVGQAAAGKATKVGQAVATKAGQAAVKGAKAVKTQVSESVGADVARATVEAGKAGAKRVSNVRQGKTGSGADPMAGGATPPKTEPERKLTPEDVPSFAGEVGKVNPGGPKKKPTPQDAFRTQGAKPKRSRTQAFADLFKADDIENPEGLARWLAQKYDGVPTTTKPGERGWARIQTYLTALRDRSTQERRGKVNRTINPKTGKTSTGPLYGSRKKKAPQSHKQRAKTAMENHGWSYHDASINRFSATNKPPTHKNQRRKAGQTVADKRLGPQEDFKRKYDKKVARGVRQAQAMVKKQMPNNELLHKQRQDILERLEKLV